jgi:hypothetical protein
LELLCKSYRNQGQQFRLKFVQLEKHEDWGNNESLSDVDSYDDDSDRDDDKSEQDDVSVSVAGHGNGIKVDIKSIRYILKTMVNLLRVSDFSLFSIGHRRQLATFLDDLRIGEQADQGLEELSRRDAVIGAYHVMLLDQIQATESSNRFDFSSLS